MRWRLNLIGTTMALMAVTVVAQTTVTTSGGTTNTVPVYTGTATLGNSPISVSGSNVGIGTTNSPVYPLTIGSSVNSVSLSLPNTGYVGATDSNGNVYTLIGGAGGDLYVGSGAGNSWTNAHFFSGGAERLTILSNGNVGIQTTNPRTPLDIQGAFSANAPSLSSIPTLRVNGGGALSFWFGNYAYTSTWLQSIQDDGSNLLKGLALQPLGGYVGIGPGSLNPQYPLDVTGQVRATSGYVFPDGSVQNTAFNPYDLNVYQLNSGGNGINLSIPTTGAAPFITWQTADSTNNLFSMRFWGGASAGWAIGNGNDNGFSALMTILTDGDVGIGTTNPGATLEVNGKVKLTAGSGASITFQDGTVQSTAYTGVTCGGDYAESVDVTGDRKKYEPGDVLVISSDDKGDVAKSSEPYSTTVVGIYSTKPGTVGRRQSGPKSPREVPMAMVGIVPTKVTAENGPIHRGDLLVTSSTPGYAMKGTDRSRMLGAVIGKALGNLDSGRGVIEVVVTLQ